MKEEPTLSAEVRFRRKSIEEELTECGHQLEKWQWDGQRGIWYTKCKDQNCHVKADVKPNKPGSVAYGSIQSRGIGYSSCPN